MDNENPEPPEGPKVNWDRVIAVAGLVVSLLPWLFPRDK